MSIYAGTPRALCHLEDPIEKNDYVCIIAGSTLSCGLMTNASLLKIQHLLPENVIIGPNDIVPGVVDSIHSDSQISEYCRNHFFNQMGNVQCVIFSSMLLLYKSSNRLHFTSRAGLCDICEVSCYSFWNSVADQLSVAIGLLQDCTNNSNISAHKPNQVTHLV